MQFDDARNLEVFQLCCDIIGRTTMRINEHMNKLSNLLPLEDKERIPQEVRQFIADIQPCIKKAEFLRNTMGDTIPNDLQQLYGVRGNAYDDAVRRFNLSGWG